jgi:formylglycine-generating enzyme required for sulfatase activity
VGLFRKGATPEGICDLEGNVWEWVTEDVRILRAPSGLRLGSVIGLGNIGFRSANDVVPLVVFYFFV